ncbi:MAG: AAA family ATPase, partial [Parvibaculaceae bacterium]
MPERARSSAAEAEHLSNLAHNLQLALAVRTWADPTLLLDKRHTDSDRRRALESVGPLCDIGIGPEAGKWFLRINARQRLTAHMEASEAGKAIASAPKDDPVTRALAYLLAVETVSLDSFSSRDLAVLREVRVWAERWVRRPVGDNELRRRIARKLLVENFQQQLPGGFVGREAELKKISEVLLAPAKTPGTPAANRFFVHGQGGVGKSSFVAELGLRLIAANPASLLAVLDFDRADLDPLRHSILDFDFLSQLATADENAAAALGPLIAGIRKQRSPDNADAVADEDNPGNPSDRAAAQGERSLRQPDGPALESVDFEAKSLALQGVGFENLGNRPVILFLDTFERVEETESTAVSSVVRWLSTLATIHKIDDLRIVISGRNDPDEGEPSWSSLPVEQVRLGPLSADESRKLFRLLAQGSSPAQDRLREPQFLEAVVKVSQGIPLIIRLIVGLLEHLDDDDVAEILKPDGTLPVGVVQGLLYDRTLRHIPDKRAQLYAHPGLVLPRLDVDLIHKVLAPMVERERRVTKRDAEAIFRGLQQPRWLTLISADGRSLRARPDLRALLLGLMANDPKRAAEVAEVRAQARVYHVKSKGSRHRAYRFYYDLLTVRTRDDLTAFEGLELRPYLQVLREHIADLPPVAQHFLKSEQGRKLPLAEAARSLPDRAWARYLAGAEGVRGEGERIVERADPMLVLPVWRERPTGERGRPPTFVIQALAETGEWRTEEVDVGAVVGELRETLAGSPPMWRDLLKRLYWLTRYALLARPGPLAEDHAALLREVLDRSSPAPAISALPSIAAVADAFAGGRDPILVDAERWLSPKIDAPGRIRFVLGAFGDTAA